MGTTINVVCYKSKVLKNNESPLMVRICKDRKVKYESIGISAQSEIPVHLLNYQVSIVKVKRIV